MGVLLAKQSSCFVQASAGAAYPAAWDAGLHIRRSCLYWYEAAQADEVSAYSRIGYWNIP